MTSETLPPRAVARLEELIGPPRPRRIVVLAKRKRHTRVSRHLMAGFRAHECQVLWLRPSRLRKRLGRTLAERLVLRKLLGFRPDLVLVYKHDASPELLDSLPPGLPLLVYYEDLPLDPNAPGERLLEVARRSSLLFTTAGGMIPVFERLGVPRALYLRGGCDPVDHVRGRRRAAYEGDVAFIGAAFGDLRLELIRAAAAARFALKLYGRGWRDHGLPKPARVHVYPRHYRDICASSRIVLGVDLRDDVELYFSNRTWLTLGCGGFLLTRYVPGLEEFFTNHEHLVWFRSTEEALELAERYLKHDEQRERIARAGYDYVHTYHTFRHAAAEILGTTFGEPWHRAADAPNEAAGHGPPPVRSPGS